MIDQITVRKDFKTDVQPESVIELAYFGQYLWR